MTRTIANASSRRLPIITKYIGRFAHRRIPHMTLVGVLLFLHFQMNVMFGDAPFFRKHLLAQFWQDFIIQRYYTWSSRSLVEGVLAPLTFAPWLWHILDILVILLIVNSMGHIFQCRRSDTFAYWAIVLSLGCYPIMSMYTAGWMATTLNYSWPFACGIFSVSCIIRLLRRNTRPSWRTADDRWFIIQLGLSFPATLFAANVEQMTILLLLVVGALCTVDLLRSHRLNAFVISQLVLILASFAFILASPGNANRSIQEVRNHWPDKVHFAQALEYSDLSLVHKLFIAGASTLDQYLLSPSWITCALTVMLSVAIWQKAFTRNGIKRAASLAVATVPLVLLMLQLPAKTKRHSQLRFLSYHYFDFTDGRILLTVCQLIVCLLIIVELYWLYGKSNGFLAAIFILAAGFATRMAMGFSPTIFASSTRTFFFMDMCLIFVTSMITLTTLRHSQEPNHYWPLQVLTAFSASSLTYVLVNMPAD